MESGQIRDHQISASSQLDNSRAAFNGRLNVDKEFDAWGSVFTDQNPWLQVDFMVNTTVSAISTQGRKSANHWVKSYSLSYSNNGIDFQFHKENGQIKVVT